ncbi:uncharacterized protein [Rutidosis leptorrhynchoides]|uniref:uncharacterized protein n=1 Tax=Rutidosis leptorrhynchoides TaxID=125765 RepID=UPI003A99CC1F
MKTTSYTFTRMVQHIQVKASSLRIKMITGDNVFTSKAIATEYGFGAFDLSFLAGCGCPYICHRKEIFSPPSMSLQQMSLYFSSLRIVVIIHLGCFTACRFHCF